MQDALLDVAVRQDGQRQHERRLQADQLDAADRGQGRPSAGRRPPRCGVLTRARSWLVSCSRSSSTWCADWKRVKKSATTRRCAGASAGLAVEVVDEEAVARGRSGSGPPRCGAGRGSPRARGRSCRCGRWRSTRRGRGSARSVCDPTGCAVEMYSSTMARRMAAFALVELHWHSILPSASRRGPGRSSASRSRAATSLPRSRPRRVRTARSPVPGQETDVGELVDARDHAMRIGPGARKLDPTGGAHGQDHGLRPAGAGSRVSLPASVEVPAPTAAM